MSHADLLRGSMQRIDKVLLASGMALPVLSIHLIMVHFR